MLELIKKKFFKDVSWTLGSTFIQSGSGILINILVGNFYEAEGLGIFNQAVAVYMLLAPISVFGLNNSVVKYTSEYKDDKKKMGLSVSTALALSFLFSFIAPAVFYLLVFLFPAMFKNASLLPVLGNILVALPFYSANKVLMGFANGMRKMRLFSAIRAMRWLLIISFIVFSYYTKKSLAFTLFAFPATEVLLFLWQFLYLKKSYSLPFTICKEWTKTHLSFGSKTFLTGSISQFNTKIDILMIGFLISDYHAGIYSFAASIARGFIMAASVVSTNFNPVISSLWSEKNIELLKSHISKIRQVSAFIMLSLLTAAAVIYPFFVELSMKSLSYTASYPVFYILLPGIAIVSIFHWSGGMLSMAGFPGQSTKISSFVLGFNIVANAILIYLMGINGAALATSLSYCWVILLQRIFIKKKLGLRIF